MVSPHAKNIMESWRVFGFCAQARCVDGLNLFLSNVFALPDSEFCSKVEIDVVVFSALREVICGSLQWSWPPIPMDIWLEMRVALVFRAGRKTCM